MNAATKEESRALTLPERAAVALGESANEAKLRELAAKSAGIISVTNPDGREEAHRAGMVLLKTRTSIDKAADVAVADAKGFVKAVGVKKAELISIIQPEETRVMALRDQWDEKVAAEKAAKIAAERARVEAIQARITTVRNLPASVVGKSAAEISQMIFELARTITPYGEHEATFAEFEKDYRAARTEVLELLAQAETRQLGVEAAALAAEEARKAEAARIEQERAELARLRAESERIANEQAIEAKRLADLAAAQEAAAAALRAKAEANLRAEREAQETAMRLEREKAAKERAEAMAELDAKQAALDAARIAHELRLQLEGDHAEALEMNATIDAERHARAQTMVDQAIADAAAMPSTLNELMAATLPLPESVSEHDAMVDAGFDEGPTDSEIIEVIMEMFGMGRAEAVARLAAIDFVAAEMDLAA
jgi:hypothetical protein